MKEPIVVKIYFTPAGLPAVVFEGEADGAIPNGTQVRKVSTQEGDRTSIGALGTVYSSIDGSELADDPAALGHDGQPVLFFYFIEWDDRPGVYIGITDAKIEEV